MEVRAIETLLLRYIQNPERSLNFCDRNFCKALIQSYLKFSLDGKAASERTHIYEQIKKYLKKFKFSNTEERSLKGVKAYLEKEVLNALLSGSHKNRESNTETDKKNDKTPSQKRKTSHDDEEDTDEGNDSDRTLPPPKKVERKDQEEEPLPDLPPGVDPPSEGHGSGLPRIIHVCSEANVVFNQETPPDSPSTREIDEAIEEILDDVLQGNRRRCIFVKKYQASLMPFKSVKQRQKMALPLRATAQSARGMTFKLSAQTCNLVAQETTPAGFMSIQSLSVEELLYWPGVTFTVSLMGLEIKRTMRLNPCYELAEDRHVDLEENSKAIHRFYENQAIYGLNPPEKDTELAHDLILVYLELLKKSIEQTDHPKKTDFLYILHLLVIDLKHLERCFLNIGYGYFLNNYPYERVFKKKGEKRWASNRLNLVERINPEVVFKITRFALPTENSLTAYFTKILEMKDVHTINHFNTTLTKGISVSCSDCNFSPQGSMFLIMMASHLKGYCPQPYVCSHCDAELGQYQLVRDRWSHKCDK